MSSLPYISIAYYMQKEGGWGPDSMQKCLDTGRPTAICQKLSLEGTSLCVGGLGVVIDATE